MFTLGGQELLIIVVLALLLFGPDKIPQLAKTIGRFTKEFNKYRDIMESTIRQEISRAEGPTVDELTVEQRISKAGAASQALMESSGQSPDAALAGLGEAGVTDAEPPEPAATVRAVPSADESDEEGEE